MAGRKLVLWFLVVLVVAALEVTPVAAQIKVTNAKACPGRNVNAFHDVTFTYGAKVGTMSGELNVTEPWEDVTVTAKLVKCKTIAAATYDCDGGADVRFVKEYPDFCKLVTGPGHVRKYPWWHITMPMALRKNIPEQCPIPKDNYYFQGGIWDTTFLENGKLTKGKYAYDMMFIRKGNELACIRLEFYGK